MRSLMNVKNVRNEKIVNNMRKILPFLQFAYWTSCVFSFFLCLLFLCDEEVPCKNSKLSAITLPRETTVGLTLIIKTLFTCKTLRPKTKKKIDQMNEGTEKGSNNNNNYAF